MSYRVIILDSVREAIASWQLSDFLLIEVYVRLRDDLGKNPLQHVRRITIPFEGMAYAIFLMDPANRFCEHVFIFHLVFGQDEETVLVTGARYLRQFGS
jgi:hypothetical protein